MTMPSMMPVPVSRFVDRHFQHFNAALLQRTMNRVTDTCIPEHEAMRRIETAVLTEWQRADRAGEPLFPHEFPCSAPERTS